MAEMDRALGGEYIFDRAFLESSVRELSGLSTRSYTASMPCLGTDTSLSSTGIKASRAVLDDILAGGLGTFWSESCPALFRPWR